MIDKEAIVDFFNNLKKDNNFNTEEKLLWSYFFLDKDKSKLEDFSFKLEQLEFKFDSIFEAYKSNEEDDTAYYLQVTKIEHHTIESLNNLNIKFYHLAEVNNIDFYDGFDVGNVYE